ncbi:MAG TPA: ABC transporter permease [Cyclobacteriaceae bacterium]|nr:ABC transporter permease [Cyclobacteriaceae bacterium]
MVKNYFLIAIRSFLKHKSFTFLNIIGLTLGMVASLLILQYVKYERSYDTFHSKAKDIYRIQYNQWQNGKLRFECAAAVPAVGPALKNNFPEVKAFTRLFPVSGIASYVSPERGVIAFREEKMQITDSSIFEVFDVHLLEGNKADALKGPDKAVISEQAAKKYFSSENPIGKTFSWDGNRKFEVTGIFENLPENSHIKFDFLFSYETLNRETQNNSETSWGWYDFNTYVLLSPGTDAKALQAKWDKWLEKERGEEWKKNNSKQEFILQPLLDIHQGERLLQESQPEQQGDADSVYALSVIALFILIIAWVNYINLATAKSFERANEVGVRKVMGAMRDQIMKQFLIEAFIVNLIAAVISLLTVRFLWPYFSVLSGRNIPTSYLQQTDFWILLGILFLTGTIFSGFYPALVLSSFKPVQVLKGKLLRARHGDFLRKSLVVFQFWASVVLIIGSAIVYQQLKFMRSQDLGIDIDRTLVIKGPGAFVDSLFQQSMEGLKEASLRIPGIKSMTAASNVPGEEIFWAMGIRRINGGTQTTISGYSVGIDDDYIPSFNLNLVAGRNFDLDHPNEKRGSVILNEAMVRALDFKDPMAAIGEKVQHGGDTLEIVGVLQNYHQMSLKESITPLVYRYRPQFASFFAFKLESDDYARILSALEKPWKEFFPGNPLDHFYLDQFFNRQYDQDKKFGQIFSLFTLLAIFVACLGLFGLASFMTMQRTKEIGIRKVLGSSVSQVVTLLSKGFIQLVIIANVIAWPVAWYVMDKWLQSFPYRIDINFLLFAMAGLGVLIIAFVSVGFQTLKAARINPAITLKSE